MKFQGYLLLCLAASHDHQFVVVDKNHLCLFQPLCPAEAEGDYYQEHPGVSYTFAMRIFRIFIIFFY